MRRFRATLVATLVLTYALGRSAGAEGPVHLGVASCSGSTCHGRSAPTGSVVRQDEIAIWQDPSSVAGAHAKAYTVLLSDRSRSIASKLGLSKPAHEAAECLGCHADPIPAGRRGPTFQVNDGVTCEACHGGAEFWLDSHYAADASHADSVAKGMVPLEDPAVRADVCLGCHSSTLSPNQFVSHRIMGAGHPRLSFELDLFTALQSHHAVDRDYARRKPVAGAASTWAIGQAMALEKTLLALADPRRGMDGIFPELVFFDCHACHQTISDARGARSGWRANPGRALGPGVPPLNDANLIMLKAMAREVAPDLASRLAAQGRTLHGAVTRDRGAVVAAARALAATSRALAERFAARPLTADGARAILRNILAGSIGKEFTNYAGAEQAVMAVDSLLAALEEEGLVPPDARANVQPQLDAAYEATRSAQAYRPDAFRAALTRIDSGLKPW